MVERAIEVPVSYLNKGQTYNVTVVDRASPMINSDLIQYRTFVRVSFDDDERKTNIAACWQFWKEGRGLSESHRHGGKLLAVECVGRYQGGNNDHDKCQIQVEQMSFGRFCVTWTATPAVETPECRIFVRFNFLSTDFSRSKGVKGIPVRLCAKTQVLPLETMPVLRVNRTFATATTKIFGATAPSGNSLMILHTSRKRSKN